MSTMRLCLAGKIIPKNEGVSTGAKGTLLASYWLITTLHYFLIMKYFFINGTGSYPVEEQWPQTKAVVCYMIRSDKHGLVSCGKAHHSGGVTKACFCFFFGCHWPFY